MWLVASYASTALFSLKASIATSSGGKTLLAPTPYALKMALLDAAYRTLGVHEAEACWPMIRDLQIAYRPPEYVSVTNLFTRILKPGSSAQKRELPFGKTIGYREYVQFSEPLRLVFAPTQAQAHEDLLVHLLARVNYMGKRGSFVQLVALPDRVDDLPEGFVRLNAPQGQSEFDVRGTLQMLDDCSSKMSVAQANAFSDESIQVGRERLSYPVVLPYQVVRASKGYTLYKRLN